MKMLGIAFATTLFAGVMAVPAAGASAAVSVDPQPVVATFDVAGQQFSVRYTKPKDIELARRVLAGQANPVPHPSGTIVYGSPDVNPGYSWHLDPVGWADQSTEVCDGRPKDVEHHAITSPFYCPFSAKLIGLR